MIAVNATDAALCKYLHLTTISQSSGTQLGKLFSKDQQRTVATSYYDENGEKPHGGLSNAPNEKS